MVALQQLPQGLGMALYPVGSADDQNGTVQHLEGALHLAGKIHMARGVQQGHLHGGQGEDRLLGEDGNAPLPLQGVGIQKSVLMVYPAQFAYRSTDVEHPLREGGLARVHVGQYANHKFLHICHPLRSPVYEYKT